MVELVYCNGLENRRVRNSPVGSNPTPSANLFQVHSMSSVESDADVALAVERVLGKDEVASSNLAISTRGIQQPLAGRLSFGDYPVLHFFSCSFCHVIAVMPALDELGR